MKKIGLDAISYYVPSIYLSIEQLSEKRNLDFQKLNKGLGLEKMAIASDILKMLIVAIVMIYMNLTPQTTIMNIFLD